LRYIVLGVLIGLVVATKYTGIIVAGAALVAALTIGWTRERSWRPFAWVGLAGVAGLLTVLALNPAYWNNPIEALKATITARTQLLDSQVRGAPLAYTTS